VSDAVYRMDIAGKDRISSLLCPSEAACLVDRKHRDRCDALALYCRNPSVFRPLSPEQLDQVEKIVGFGTGGRSIDG
jgi:hypothetical protein